MANILDIKYNEIREIEKKYKLFIIKLHILLLLIDTDNITDEDKETIKKYVEEKLGLSFFNKTPNGYFERKIYNYF